VRGDQAIVKREGNCFVKRPSISGTEANVHRPPGPAAPAGFDDPSSPDPTRPQGRWGEFLLGDDPKEGAVRDPSWAVGGEGFRLRLRQV
jgi:hypothetical protein